MTALEELATREAPLDAEAHQRLHTHLVLEHRRLPHELTGLPLDAVHHLEHFDDAIGLLTLGHRH